MDQIMLLCLSVSQQIEMEHSLLQFHFTVLFRQCFPVMPMQYWTVESTDLRTLMVLVLNFVLILLAMSSLCWCHPSQFDAAV